jgi:hypothetical protein
VLAANYDFGVTKLYGAYGRDKGPNSAPLLEALYGWGDEIDSNAIEVFVHNLRK